MAAVVSVAWSLSTSKLILGIQGLEPALGAVPPNDVVRLMRAEPAAAASIRVFCPAVKRV